MALAQVPAGERVSLLGWTGSNARSKRPSSTASTKHPVHDPTDILALVLMALFVVRRMEIRGTEGEAFRRVPPSEFAAWQSMAIRARSVAVNACFLKVFLNVIWYFALRRQTGSHLLQIGGLLIFVGWIAGLIGSSWLSYRARKVADRLGIVIGRRLSAPSKANDGSSPPNH